MTIKQNIINKLVEVSKEVISDCAVENGAIVASNSDKSYYPREAADYRYVWPRDASFTCLAAEYLNLPIQIPFFKWLLEMPEDFKKEQLLYSNYSTNGRIGSMGKMFEADQMGTVLLAIYEHYKNNFKQALEFKELIERLANGLCAVWNKTFFIPNVVDLWEDGFRKTSSAIENNFTYSLAACAKGLLCANEIIPNKIWKESAREMINKINDAYDKQSEHFLRNHGRIDDKNIDASLLGLVYPFEIIKPDDKRMQITINKIEKELIFNGGVHRFQFDYFDSEGTAWEGGGAWPALNFWMAIYWHLAQNEKKAKAYYNWVIEKVDKYIPEQIFSDFRIGIYPLAWSHAMFIIASHYLGYLK